MRYFVLLLMSLLVFSFFTNIALAEGSMQPHSFIATQGLHALNLKEMRREYKNQYFDKRFVPSVDSDMRRSSEVDVLVARRRRRVTRLISVRGGRSVGDLFSKLDHIRLPDLSLPVIKLLLQLGLSILNVVCWIIPIKSQNFTQNTYALGMLNPFLIHPKSLHTFMKYFSHTHLIASIPLSFVCIDKS